MSTQLLPQLLVLLLLMACPPAHVSACGGYTEGISAGYQQTVTSPNYPASYERNGNCVWLFVANYYTELQANVTFMQLETHANGSCKDYVLVTEGSATATQLGSLCSGASADVMLVTLSRHLWIQFRSDHQGQGAGFVLTVTAADNSLANATASPVTACKLTQYSCPNKQCIDTSYLCDNVNDCGCSDYGCDETKCWLFERLTSVGFNWGVGVGIGFFIGLLLLLIFGLYEMPQHRRPECMKRKAAAAGLGDSSETGCLLACSQRCRRNKVDQRKPGDQFKSMLERMSAVRHPLRWETESESSRPVSRRTSASGPGSQGGSRRSSYQLSVSAASYGNTLSPKDLPPRLSGAAGTSTAAAIVAPSPKSAAAGAAASGATLLVPSATTPV